MQSAVKRFFILVIGALLFVGAVPAIASSHTEYTVGAAGDFQSWKRSTSGGGDKWINSINKDYNEGDIVPLSIYFDGLMVGDERFVIFCLQHTEGTAASSPFAFSDIAPPEGTVNPLTPKPEDPSGNIGSSTTTYVDGEGDSIVPVVSDEATIDSVSYLGVDAGGCSGGSNPYLSYRIEFTVTAATGDGVLYFGARVAIPGRTTAAGVTVPAGQGAGQIGGNYQARIESGDKTIQFTGAAITASLFADKSLAMIDDVPPISLSSPITLSGGDTVRYTLRVDGDGGALNNIVFSDDVPTDTTYSTGSTLLDEGCDDAGATQIPDVGGGLPLEGTGYTYAGPLADGDYVCISFEVVINRFTIATCPSTIVNTATFRADEPPDALSRTATNDVDCSTAVELASFVATVSADGDVALTWTTAVERDNAGFNVYRSTSATFDSASATALNLALIAAQGALGQGASYSAMDEAVSYGTWYYFLEDVDLQGASTLHGPIVVTIEQPTAVSLSGLSGGESSSLLLLVGLALGLVLLVGTRALRQ